MSTQDTIQDLLKQDYSVRQIANLLGISTQAVYKHLKSLDIKPPTKASL